MAKETRLSEKILKIIEEGVDQVNIGNGKTLEEV